MSPVKRHFQVDGHRWVLAVRSLKMTFTFDPMGCKFLLKTHFQLESVTCVIIVGVVMIVIDMYDNKLLLKLYCKLIYHVYTLYRI